MKKTSNAISVILAGAAILVCVFPLLATPFESVYGDPCSEMHSGEGVSAGCYLEGYLGQTTWIASSAAYSFWGMVQASGGDDGGTLFADAYAWTPLDAECYYVEFNSIDDGYSYEGPSGWGCSYAMGLGLLHADRY